MLLEGGRAGPKALGVWGRRVSRLGGPPTASEGPAVGEECSCPPSPLRETEVGVAQATSGSRPPAL